MKGDGIANIQFLHHILQKHNFSNRSLLILAMLILVSLNIKSEPLNDLSKNKSIIETSINIPLQELQEAIEKSIPHTITNINENNRTCVEAEWLKTKVPTFKGLKIYSKTVKTKITPEIKCDISGWVRKAGNVSISSSGNLIRISLPIEAKVSAKAGVRETATASAIVFIDFQFDVNEKWQPVVDVRPNFTWSERPNLKLFGIIKITIAGKVEPMLREKLNELKDQVSNELAAIDLKKEANKAWISLFNPIHLSGDKKDSILFKPKSIYYGGYSVVNNNISINIAVEGELSANIGYLQEKNETLNLPDLKKINIDKEKFIFLVPTNISYSKLTKIVSNAYPDGIQVKVSDEKIYLKEIEIRSRSAQRIEISMSVEFDKRNRLVRAIDVFDWWLKSIDLIVSGEVDFDKENQIISLQNMQFKFDSEDRTLNKLINNGLEPIIQGKLETLLSFEAGKELKTFRDSISKEIVLDENITLILQKLETPLIEDIEVLKEKLIIRWVFEGSPKIMMSL